MTDRPRVAILTREYPPEVYGGAGVHVEHLAAALTAHVDVEVHCFGAPRDDPLVAGSYQPWEVLAGSEPHAAALGAMSVDLAMAAAVEGVDLVHSHTWYANLAGHLAKLLHGVPHVMTTHSLEPLRPWKAEQLGGGYALSRFCERTAIEQADAVIAVSAAMRDDVLTSYATVAPDRVHVLHNGIDPEVYAPDAATDALQAHGVDPTAPTVLFVGRITRQKGLPHLLRAARLLDPGVQVVLCAGAPDTPDIATEVRGLVEALQRERERVVWIDQTLPRDEIVQLLTHATVFVCPSVYEPFGLVNLEAMACGTAVVATATGGIPEIVVDGRTGLLVPIEARDDGAGEPADADLFTADLAARLDEVATDPARAEEMGRAGRQRVLDHFTWDRVAEGTAALYATLPGALKRRER